MASEIKIKGKKEPLITTFLVADRIKALYLNREVPAETKIEIDDWVGTKADIKSVWLDRQGDISSRAEKLDIIAESNKSYIEQRKIFQAKTVEEKAAQLSFFKMIWYGFHKVIEVPEDVLKKAEKLQVKFFKEHPFNIVPDPLIFRELVNKEECDTVISNIMLSTVSTDRKYTEQEELYHGSIK